MRFVRDANTSVRSLGSASTSQIGKKAVSPDRELIPAPLTDNESLIVQLKTVRLNDVCTKHAIQNIVEIVLSLSQEFGHLRKDIEILKTEMKTISATERPSMAYVQDLLTRRDVTSSAAPKNNAEKTYQDTFSVRCVSLPRNLQLSAGIVIDMKEKNQASDAPGTLKTGNDVPVSANDDFTTVKWTKAKKLLALHHSLLRKINSLRLG
jgi:hypothetical protein